MSVSAQFVPPLVYAGPVDDLALEQWFTRRADALISDPRGEEWGVRGRLGLARRPLRLFPEGVCHWCGAAVAGRRRRYCSTACADRRALRSWGTLRQFILLRDGMRCTDCGRTALLAKVKRLEVDHVIAVVAGGTDHPNNLRTKCGLCHYTKSASDARARRTAWEV